MVVGSLADVVEDQFQRLFDRLGVGPVSFFPLAVLRSFLRWGRVRSYWWLSRS